MSSSLDDYMSDNSDESFLVLIKQQQTASSAPPAASRAPSTASRVPQQTARHEHTLFGAPRDASLPSAADERRREALQRLKNCDRSRRHWARVYANPPLHAKLLAKRRVRDAAKRAAARRARDAAKRRCIESSRAAARHRDRLRADSERRAEALAKGSREYRRARDAAKPRRDGSPCAAARHRVPVRAGRERRAAAAVRRRVRLRAGSERRAKRRRRGAANTVLAASGNFSDTREW